MTAQPKTPQDDSRITKGHRNQREYRQLRVHPRLRNLKYFKHRIIIYPKQLKLRGPSRFGDTTV